MQRTSNWLILNIIIRIEKGDTTKIKILYKTSYFVKEINERLKKFHAKQMPISDKKKSHI